MIHRSGAIRLAAAAMLLTTAGCADPALLDAAAKYADTAEAAAAAYGDVSARHRAAERAEGYDRLAADDAVPFVDRGACVPLAGAAPRLADCTLKRDRTEEGTASPLIETPEYATLDALAEAMRRYAVALGELAEGAGSGEDAFREAAVDLGGALGRLESAAADVDAGVSFPEGVPGAVGAVIAEAGALWLEARRIEALREIVPRTDPAVQAATETLERAYAAMMESVHSQAYDDRVQPLLNEAMRAQARLGAAELRAAAAELDAAVAEHRAKVSADLGAYAAFVRLGEAHAALADAAERDDRAAYRRALERIADAAEALAEPLETVVSGG